MRLSTSALALVVLLTGCASPEADPLVGLAKELAQHEEYSVLLADMEVRGNFVKSYFHRYDLIRGDEPKGVEAAPSESETTTPGGLEFVNSKSDWIEVRKKFYLRYEPYLGMVVLSKSSGQSPDQAQYPPGYQYVGDSRYGRWTTDRNGGSFWAFYGKYALFSSLLGMNRRPLYRDDFNAYRRTRSQGRPYFGSSGNYGTRGSVTRATNPSFFARQQQRQSTRSRDFKSRVRNRTGGSTSRNRGGSFRGK